MDDLRHVRERYLFARVGKIFELMAFIQGIEEIRQAFAQVEENFERDSWRIPKKISDSWVFMIHIADAIDTGDYLRSVNYREGSEVENVGDFMQWTVDTLDNEDVDYPGFVEGGTDRMSARFPAQKAIEREDFVSSIDAMADRGLGF